MNLGIPWGVNGEWEIPLQGGRGGITTPTLYSNLCLLRPSYLSFYQNNFAACKIHPTRKSYSQGLSEGFRLIQIALGQFGNRK